MKGHGERWVRQRRRVECILLTAGDEAVGDVHGLLRVHLYGGRHIEDVVTVGSHLVWHTRLRKIKVLLQGTALRCLKRIWAKQVTAGKQIRVVETWPERDIDLVRHWHCVGVRFQTLVQFLG